MNKRKSRLHDMLFNDYTSTRHDFRKRDLCSAAKTEYTEKPRKKKFIASSIVKNSETMGEYKKPVPFTLFIKKNSILHKDPRDIQQPFVENRQIVREMAQKTRPRITMVPAVCLDDVDCPDTRARLVNDIYKTTVLKAQQETVNVVYPRGSLKAPLGNRPAPARPIFLPDYQPPYVSPEWRMQSASWDRRQDRYDCDATKEFWLQRADGRLAK